MIESGKTPLLRVEELEDDFEVGEIYLKLEGINPTEHKVDRIAEMIVKDAYQRGEKEIYGLGSKPFMQSLSYFTDKYEMTLIPITMDNESVFENIESSYPNKYLAIEGHNNKQLSQMILEDLDQEIVDRLGYDIQTIFSEFSYGYTITSTYNVFLKGWMKDAFETFPKIFSATYGQAKQLSSKDLTAEVDNALYECNGENITLEEKEILEAYEVLKKAEIYLPEPKDAIAFAAFMSKARQGELKHGKHVIILNNGRSMLDVHVENNPENKGDIFSYTKDWLQEYGDPAIEMNEAIANAYEKGYVLVASRNGIDQGICILVYTGFENFLPTYHLAYVGTDPESSGRGIGTELVKKAIEVSEGKISLHVDLTNDRAKRLYEKLGFKHVYDRMMYQSME